MHHATVQTMACTPAHRCPTYYWHNYRQACAYLVDNDAYELPQAEDTAYGLNGGLDRNGVSPQQFDR